MRIEHKRPIIVCTEFIPTTLLKANIFFHNFKNMYSKYYLRQLKNEFLIESTHAGSIKDNGNIEEKRKLFTA